MQGTHRNRRPRGSQAIEASMVSRAEEMVVGLWDLKGKEDNSQNDEKE